MPLNLTVAQAGLIISATADLQGFSCTVVYRKLPRMLWKTNKQANKKKSSEQVIFFSNIQLPSFIS